MALLFPAAAAASAAWALLGYAHAVRRDAVKEVENSSQDPEVKEPFQGAIGHAKQHLFADTRGLFTSVQEDVDVQGARIFWVDYGNGQRVQQYFDPRILL